MSRSRAVTSVLAAVAALTAWSVAPPPLVLADPVSPVSMTHSGSPNPVGSGAQLTYTITMTNTGGAKVDNAVFSDQVNGVGGIGVPPQYVLTSTRGACQQNVNLVTCQGGKIEGGGSWTVNVSVRQSMSR